jgi:endogenous inhibitor of DNA gyrase (YacG/DUF329 family)
MASHSIVKCPICGRENDLTAEPFGPFCSPRCKLIDLGKWLNEEYKISEPLTTDHLVDYEKLEGNALDEPESE